MVRRSDQFFGPLDKLKAIDMAMRYFGLYERDNTRRSQNLQLQIVLVK
ncbi:hypothetical protein UFOVP833_10 [uncultured Caudovirales phage]|uniref:Uncharacterized protein n=1 Tax=uncultured Caudovirales phage TaxID=2100421 RepID=A0A6J5P1G9_9CAUD|nr:hypothetical protein UFOVP833_10 [uncultured Caudovirales phage]CAB4218143.1 hypothetical protein UFOVP1603_15 [uncultured Caudovirales phage]